MKSYARKILTLVVSAILVFSLFGCSENSNQEVINVYNWGDYIDEDVLKIFEEETGIKVNYENFATNEDMYVKIKNGGSDYDIAIPSDYMIEKMIKEDLLETIDTSALENYGQIDPLLKSPHYDTENEYSVPYMWGTLGILYNKTMVSEEIDSWDALWDEQYRGQIFMYNSLRDSLGVSLKRLGYSLNTRDINELNNAKQALIDQLPLVLSYAGDDVKDKMIGGEGALAVVYSGDAILCMSENPDLAYVVPKEGSNFWFDGIVIPKTTQNKEGALKFIDFLCRPDIALRNTEYIGYTTPVLGAIDMLDDEIKNNKAYLPDQESLDNCEPFYDLGEFTSEYDKAWTEVLAN